MYAVRRIGIRNTYCIVAFSFLRNPCTVQSAARGGCSSTKLLSFPFCAHIRMPRSNAFCKKQQTAVAQPYLPALPPLLHHIASTAAKPLSAYILPAPADLPAVRGVQGRSQFSPPCSWSIGIGRSENSRIAVQLILLAAQAIRPTARPARNDPTKTCTIHITAHTVLFLSSSQAPL